jgi:hypothetical protein
MRTMVVIQQGSHLRVGDQHNVATVSAIAAIGAAQGFELFAVYRNTPVTAVSGVEVQYDTVDERRHDTLSSFCIVP